MCSPICSFLFSLSIFSEVINFQVNLVDWLKKMVTDRNPEGVLDPKLPEKPSSRALKRLLLVALRCVDPNAQKRPKMGHLVHMLEAEEGPLKDVCICVLLRLIQLFLFIPFSISSFLYIFTVLEIYCNCK